MSRPDPADEWIFRADRVRLITELRQQGLPIDGSDSVLALRLLRRVKSARGSWGRSDDSRGGEMSDSERLELPGGEPARPDSPYETMGGRTRLSGGDTSRGEDRRESRDSGQNSATAVYNIMRKWNLKFSGARGEDAETLLLRIEEGRELIPVADEDVLRCLPFFLSGSVELSGFAGSGRGCRRGLRSKPRGERGLATRTSNSRYEMK